ncbi:uncharacterized protein N7446_009327 [Penicillium canescens]|uniref:Uncharacterized protein n=1 Tax=Penicillium canescens TaxID=5083 RepID=A0AAD6I672_PENCN|nr:uncharacterized protein N7446_009327 [Penicillium canescens]KAJ6034576.1 hypothetical protein N7460_008751 [Penicillium canescens]KAJ6046235.1 hypothetical protein N7444_007489 [Penicillium canescens]KAJ6053315.1 hypothetical protein N7446_009327 [Penicillium canescens]
MTPSYPKWDRKGEKLGKWLNNANEPGCPIPKTTVTMANLPPSKYFIYNKTTCLSLTQSNWVASLGLPVETSVEDADSVYQFLSLHKNELPWAHWSGHIGPGVMIIECIRRESDSTAPWISELTKAIYENYSSLSDLRDDDHGKWPTGVWMPPSPEFNALLGTRLGKVVAYFILGAYGQGVKRIAKITFFNVKRKQLNLRFDIENV